MRKALGFHSRRVPTECEPGDCPRSCGPVTAGRDEPETKKPAEISLGGLVAGWIMPNIGLLVNYPGNYFEIAARRFEFGVRSVDLHEAHETDSRFVRNVRDLPALSV